MKLILALLFSVSLLAQTKILNIKIDSIATDDTDPKKRIFSINYHIENLTDHEISFFLRPNTLIANAASSLTLFPIYKIYQNNHFIELDGPFYEREGSDDLNKYAEMTDKTSAEAKALLQKIMADYEARKKELVENYKKSGGKSEDEHWIIQNYNQLRSKITLKPKETKSFVIKTHWDKERYFLQDDLEYYLDEKDAFELELTLHLIKTHFKDRLSAEEFGKIAKDPNFIEGIYTSNKATLNFGN
jgi:hypothetical protein